MNDTAVRATEALARRFFAAIERGDLEQVRALYAPGVRVWHNVTGRTQTREENLHLLAAFTRRVCDLRYDDVDRHCRADGFSQRHTVRGRLASGEHFELPVALFVNHEGGVITELWEYLDGAGIAPVFPTSPRA